MDRGGRVEERLSAAASARASAVACGWIPGALALWLLLGAAATGCSDTSCAAPGVRSGDVCLVACGSNGELCYPDGARADVTAEGGLDGASDTSSGPSCDAGVACQGACIDPASDPANCGACGRVCPGATNARATCAAGVCGSTCVTGFHRCGTDCVDDTSALSCGAACAPCSAPAGAVATCAAGACGWECAPGYDRVGAGCEVRVPRPIAPLSTATSTSRRPMFRWELPAGVTGATIEVCRTRACALGDIVQTIDATGASGAASAELARGVWFWRLRGRVGGTVGTRTSAVWEFTVGARSAAVVTSWGTTLDVNGDGYADVAVGAAGALSSVGRVYVFHGGASGVASTAAVALTGPDGADAYFGSELASAGDVNGDGYADMVIGAESVMGRTGRAYVYLGGASGLTATPAVVLISPAGVDEHFATSVASAGDVNGDGYADVVVGAEAVMAAVGRAYVYLGSAGGLATTPAVTLIGPDGPDGFFGGSVASAGDINGDGYADVIVGAVNVVNDAGRAYIYLGSAAGLATTAATTLNGPAGAGGEFGACVANAGDVNGDGYSDVVVGANYVMSRTGAAYVYVGGASGLVATPAATLPGLDGMGAQFGSSLASAGDVDGDGYDDIILGDSAALNRTGRAYLYVGGASGITITPALTLTGLDGPDTGFGNGVAGAGDVNGDGFADVVISAAGAINGTGRVSIHLGGASGLTAAPAVTLTGLDGPGGYFGTSVARIGGIAGECLTDGA